MATPYSDDYKRRMQEYFSKRENKPEEKSERIIAEPVRKPMVYKQALAYSEIKKKKNIFNIGLLGGLVILFLLLSFYLLYIIPENPILWGIVLSFCVMAVFLFLFLFHKTYEKLIENVSAVALLIVIYVLLIINMFLSGYSVYSAEWAFLGFVIAGVIFYDSKIDSRFLIFPALILLGYIPFLLVAKQNALAETIAIYVYYFLVMGVGLQVAESVKNKEFQYSLDYGKTNSNLKVGEIASKSIVFPSSPSPKQTPHFNVEYKSEGLGDFEDYIKRIISAKYLGEYMIGIGLVSIVFIIMSRFMEIQILKWTSVYVFVVLLVFYVIGMLGEKEKLENE